MCATARNSRKVGPPFFITRNIFRRRPRQISLASPARNPFFVARPVCPKRIRSTRPAATIRRVPRPGLTLQKAPAKSSTFIAGMALTARPAVTKNGLLPECQWMEQSPSTSINLRPEPRRPACRCSSTDSGFITERMSASVRGTGKIRDPISCFLMAVRRVLIPFPFPVCARQI